MPRRPRVDVDDPELVAVFERIAESSPDAASLQEQVALVARARERWPDAGPTIDKFLLFELGDLRRNMKEVLANQNELRKLHDQLTSPPWYIGVFLRAVEGTARRVVVAYQNTQRVVTLAKDVDLESLRVGDDVVLSHDLNLLLETLTPSVKRLCEVGEFQYQLGAERLVMKVRDAEMLVHAAATLDVSALSHGDRVLWDPALAMAFERLPRPAESGLFLTETPTECFADVGGLDQQIQQLQRCGRPPRAATRTCGPLWPQARGCAVARRTTGHRKDDARKSIGAVARGALAERAFALPLYKAWRAQQHVVGSE